MPTILYTAVKALIKNDEGKVLVLKQSDPTITGVNQYHTPGGIIEFGETLVECVAREVEEEVGVRPTVGKLFDVGEWSAVRNDLDMQFVGLFYTCELPSYDFILEEEEASEAYWVGIDTIDSIDIMEPSKTMIRRLLQQA
ncbi:MAG: NUDIX hydrolase [Candidatus Saccharimonas sp.]